MGHKISPRLARMVLAIREADAFLWLKQINSLPNVIMIFDKSLNNHNWHGHQQASYAMHKFRMTVFFSNGESLVVLMKVNETRHFYGMIW